MSSRVLVPAGDLSGTNSKFLPIITNVIAEGKLIGGSYVSRFENQL